jgi:hypothetical protein
MGPDVENERTTKPERAASALGDGLERMFRVAKTDHPDLVGGIVWADCELRWINERITLAILAEREACAMACENFDFNQRHEIPQPRTLPRFCAAAIRMRSNAVYTPSDQ